MPSSFKKNTDLAPIRYRTPSPPRCAFEPISPIITGIAADEIPRAETNGHPNGTFKRPYHLYHHDDTDLREESHLPAGPMDVFASIALATKSSGRHRLRTSTAAQSTNDGYYDLDRPSKRAKSERLPLSDWSRTTAAAKNRPATSYEQSPENRRFEAELLLNFAHEAAKLVHSPHQSPEVNPRSLLDASWQSPSIPPDPTIQGSEERGMSFTNGKVWNFANNIKKAESQTQETGENGFASEADSRQETILNRHMSNGPASEISHTPFDRTGFEGKHLVPAIIIQQSDLYTRTGASEKGAGNGTAVIFDNSELGDAKIHEVQHDVELKDQINDSGADANAEPHNVISSDQRYRSTDPGRKDAMQAKEDMSPALKDAVKISEGQKGQKGLNNSKSTNLEVLGAPEASQEEVVDNESRTIHGALGDQVRAMHGDLTAEAEKTKNNTPELDTIANCASDVSITEGQLRPAIVTAAICASCKFGRNSPAIESDSNATSWISCDGCKSWFHFACAGFKNDREVRSVDKYRCRKCRPLYGSTTYVRKSSRAHSAIDYAGLHQGVIKTSDERPEHHYIKPIKDGTITFLPENFARMRPELVTIEYFEKGTGMKEPIVIPACFNPRPKTCENSNSAATRQPNDASPLNPLDDNDVAGDWFSRSTEPEMVLDQGQDALDMVIPQGLTVRQVAELYGQDEKVEVIDVKSQNGENKKWNMRRWVDYYENPNNKVVRNVISLEVSQSKLGRLIRRPQIVRDLDLQDSVWPGDLLAKGEYPRVQFYCLMSVADCFTDFHIDFGGSSVFYHILKGKKTFLFIPPKEKHLKKYEEWCMSPAQNWTFLGDQTKECYRVDLSEGDTMLIPAGWIHAVWTPEDSLVIGGNFLTRLNYSMQLRVAQVEKATGVAKKFRYPHFQKLHWYIALHYLEDDPLPQSVKELLHAGGTFVRHQPAHYEFDFWGENSRPGVENYHTRYYSQPELDGLPDLTRYLLRTALIDIGSISDGISAETRNAVKKSIPRGHGEPLDVLKKFAAWCAWKRGNEPIPHWAYPDAEPETLAPDKLSAAAMRKLDREAALQAPRRQSARMQSQQAASEVLQGSPGGAPSSIGNAQNDITHVSTPKKRRTSSGGTHGMSHRKTACESCRKRRRACKHKDQIASSIPIARNEAMESVSKDLDAILSNSTLSLEPDPNDGQNSTLSTTSDSRPSESNDENLGLIPEPSSIGQFNNVPNYQADDVASLSSLLAEPAVSTVSKVEGSMPLRTNTSLDSLSGNSVLVRPRHKACDECRKSKVSIISPYLLFECRLSKYSVVVYTMHMAKKIPSRSASLPFLGPMRESRTLGIKKLLRVRNIFKVLSVKVISISNSQCQIYPFSKSKRADQRLLRT